MRADVYSRIEDLVDEMRGDWRKFFESNAFEDFVRHYIQNLISGVYDSLRLQGAQIAPSILDDEMKKFKFERIYDPNGLLAYSVSKPDEFIICVNGDNRLVGQLQTIDEKFEMVVGHVVHEVGHRLFTDFSIMKAQQGQMLQMARFFPRAPQNYICTTEGALLQQKLVGDPDYRKTFATIMDNIQNYLEDGYVEAEMRSFYPGLASSYLGYKGSVWLDGQQSMTEMYNKKDTTALELVLGQWGIYSKASTLKVGEKPLEDYDAEIAEYIWNGMDLIDEAKGERDPLKRADIVNQMSVMISPLLDKALDSQKNKKSKDPEKQNQQANQQIQNKVKNLANSEDGEHQGSNTKSIVDPNRPNNSGLSSRSQSAGSGSANSSSGSSANQKNSQGNRQMPQTSTLDHSAAVRDLQNTMETAATEKVTEQMEHEHKQDMQKEARELMQGTGYSAPVIHRAESVAETNKQVYRDLASRSVAIAKRMARLLKKHLQDSEVEEYTPWQYSGRKFVAKQYCRNELKGFAQKKLPSPVFNCRVYVLVDESGSVTQELSDAEMKTCIVLEQFCHDMNIPLTIQGYTSSGDALDIFSYVEEKRIDGDDKYRLTGMKARGGTPTVNAMLYAVKRLEKYDKKENKILFVITDGSANDDDSKGTATKDLIDKCKVMNLRVIGCGIGANKDEVNAEFGDDHYLGIDDLEKMPERLLEIIRRKVYSHR